MAKTSPINSLDGIVGPDGQDDKILAVYELLHRLAEIEPRKAEVVKRRYFIGMTIEETAEVLGVATGNAAI